MQRPRFFGENGCRFAGRNGHVCRTSFGAPIQPGQCCFAEARAQVHELMAPYRRAAG